MIYKEVDSGFIVGFKVGREYREVLEISIFSSLKHNVCDAPQEKFSDLWFVLCFETMSGLKVNINKCELGLVSDVIRLFLSRLKLCGI